MIKRIALSTLAAFNAPLGALGVQLVRNRQAEASFSRRIRQLARIGFRPAVALDGGAFSGEWSLEVASVFSGCRMIVVEPNPEMMEVSRSALKALQPPPHFAEVALGPEEGAATLNLWSGASGAAASVLKHVVGDPSRSIDVRVRRLDDVATDAGELPDLLKLDLQGYEVPALKGAPACLAHAEVVILEVGCLGAYIGRSSPRDVIDLMYDSGFVLHDIEDLGYRPHDGALTGADFVFVKSKSKLREYAGFR